MRTKTKRLQTKGKAPDWCRLILFLLLGVVIGMILGYGVAMREAWRIAKDLLEIQFGPRVIETLAAGGYL